MHHDPTFIQRPLTVSLHKLPAVSAVQGDCETVYQTTGYRQWQRPNPSTYHISVASLAQDNYFIWKMIYDKGAYFHCVYLNK